MYVCYCWCGEIFSIMLMCWIYFTVLDSIFSIMKKIPITYNMIEDFFEANMILDRPHKYSLRMWDYIETYFIRWFLTFQWSVCVTTLIWHNVIHSTKRKEKPFLCGAALLRRLLSLIHFAKNNSNIPIPKIYDTHTHTPFGWHSIQLDSRSDWEKRKTFKYNDTHNIYHSKRFV